MRKLTGRAALEALEAPGSYVFHGSQDGNLTKLTPVAGGSKRYNIKTGAISEAEKYVYATTSLDLSIFVATIWRRVGASGWTTNGIREDVASFDFHASPAAIEEAAKPSTFGFVYVLPKNQFKQDEHNPYEMISDSLVEPFAIVKVTAYDLRPDFRTLTPPPQLKSEANIA